MKPGYQPTVTWPLDLAPTLEARQAVLDAFEQQTGKPPVTVLVLDEAGLWGCAGDGAVLLFRIPEGWTPE